MCCTRPNTGWDGSEGPDCEQRGLGPWAGGGQVPAASPMMATLFQGMVVV